MQKRELRCLTTTSVSACFELVNELVYFNDSKFGVLLNGQTYIEETNKNVFSLFDLQPNTHYTVKAIFENDISAEFEFDTKAESIAISVKDFFAVGDGIINDTKALQAAIDCCPKDGRIVVPQGTYLTGPLSLRSNITIELKKDAVLLGDTNPNNYAMLPSKVMSIGEGDKHLFLSTWEGNLLKAYQSLLFAYKQSNIAIVGQGKIDGNAQNSTWWNDPKNIERGRPRLVFFNNCDNITMHGNHFCNSPSWTIHPFFSRQIFAYDCLITAPKISPNTDGFDPESCDGVVVVGCDISTGDDCIAIKAGKIDLALAYNTPSQNINIRNCTMRDGHGSVVLGSELSAGMYNLTVSQCLFVGTDRGLRIKTRRGRGKLSVIENVSFDNIIMLGVDTPLTVNCFYNKCDLDRDSDYAQSRTVYPIDDRTPRIGKLSFDNILCKGVNFACGFFYGLPELPIEEIRLNNVHFEIAQDATTGEPAMLNDIAPMSKRGLIVDGVSNLIKNNVTFVGIIGDEVSEK